MAHDVALFHSGHYVVVKMQVRAADRAAGDLDDRVALVLDTRIGNRVAPDIGRAVPDQSFHIEHSLLRTNVPHPDRGGRSVTRHEKVERTFGDLATAPRFAGFRMCRQSESRI
jgi:hypothetical protein